MNLSIINISNISVKIKDVNNRYINSAFMGNDIVVFNVKIHNILYFSTGPSNQVSAFKICLDVDVVLVAQPV